MAQSTPISGSTVRSYAIETVPPLAGSVVAGYGPTNAGASTSGVKHLPSIARIASLPSVGRKPRL